ncbi:hypothetical protein QYZ45_17640 [Vibrio parahaemolyticus]|nr:hypothetical protein [Vibrio parahaemolyticus]
MIESNGTEGELYLTDNEVIHINKPIENTVVVTVVTITILITMIVVVLWAFGLSFLLGIATHCAANANLAFIHFCVQVSLIAGLLFYVGSTHSRAYPLKA